MRMVYIAVVVGVLAGCDSRPVETADNTTEESLAQRCAKEAVARGYRAASCANGFIQTCIDTQSKEKMDFYYHQVDLSLGSVNSPNCPNITARYQREFDTARSQADQF